MTRLPGAYILPHAADPPTLAPSRTLSRAQRRIWPEPARWHATVCNFVRLLAWEKTMLGVGRLFPSARLQIVRELFFGEWQARTHRLGAQLYPLYYPARAAVAAAEKARGSSGVAGPSSSSAAAAAAAVSEDDEDEDDSESPSGADMGLSAYERQRNKQILENQASPFPCYLQCTLAVVSAISL